LLLFFKAQANGFAVAATGQSVQQLLGDIPNRGIQILQTADQVIP
jgi:hypothetical protein